MSEYVLSGLAGIFAFIGDYGLVRIVLVIAVLAGYWSGLGRAGIVGGQRRTAWLAVAVPLIAWFAVIWWIAMAGVFDPRPGAPPLLPLAIFVPVLVGLVLLTRSGRLARALDAIPPEWLTGLQVYRMFGAAFLVQWGLGNLSARFALPAGIGDVLVGCLALPVAIRLRADPVGGRGMAIAWNILGIADLVIAITLGIIGQIARLRGAGDALPVNPIGYPLVMIPAFAVPLSLILHGVSIWQLRRRARQASDNAHPEPVAPEHDQAERPAFMRSNNELTAIPPGGIRQ
jgi:hypothetical protein